MIHQTHSLVFFLEKFAYVHKNIFVIVRNWKKSNALTRAWRRGLGERACGRFDGEMVKDDQPWLENGV